MEISYWVEKAQAEVNWRKYAEECLANPKATESEIKCAIIGIRCFDKELTKKLEAKKPYKLKI